MKHAGAAALDRLEPVLRRVRAHPQLREKSRGVFYLRSRAFLHFHEDPKGLFADIRLGDAWTRTRVSTPAERARLLRRITRVATRPA
ncbi:MAG: hypothetical protein ACHQ1G_05630 [Planctomycetota bacterium]